MMRNYDLGQPWLSPKVLSMVFSNFSQTKAKELLSYVVAKAELIKAAEVLAQELGPFGIRVNTFRYFEKEVYFT